MARKQRKLKFKAPWPPKCMELPATVAEIEAGVTTDVQAERDKHVVLLPCAGRLVAVEVPSQTETEAQP